MLLFQWRTVAVIHIDILLSLSTILLVFLKAGLLKAVTLYPLKKRLVMV